MNYLNKIYFNELNELNEVKLNEFNEVDSLDDSLDDKLNKRIDLIDTKNMLLYYMMSHDDPVQRLGYDNMINLGLLETYFSDKKFQYRNCYAIYNDYNL